MIPRCLLVSIVPDGEHYDWSLRGIAARKREVAQVIEDRPVLLCNKPALLWSGIAIGQSSQKKLILRNNSESQEVTLIMSIKGDHSSFQIQNNFIIEQRSFNKYEVTIKPQAELPVYVLFAPTCFAIANSSLVLKTQNDSTKFVIPLSGYGGRSNLDISGVKKVGDQLWIDMGEVYLGKRNSMQITLRNSGTRAAFIKMVCYLGNCFHMPR